LGASSKPAAGRLAINPRILTHDSHRTSPWTSAADVPKTVNPAPHLAAVSSAASFGFNSSDRTVVIHIQPSAKGFSSIENALQAKQPQKNHAYQARLL
jgi:hypothetical protein